MNTQPKAQFITPPNTLKAKVVEGGPGAVSADVLSRAEQVISDMSGEYEKWVVEDMARLNAALAELNEAKDARKPYLEKIFQIVHDMKGQGGSFDYQLISIIGDMLCRYVEKLEDANAQEIEVIGVHVNSMQVVVSQHIKGEGGAVGDKLLKGLDLIVSKTAK